MKNETASEYVNRLGLAGKQSSLLLARADSKSKNQSLLFAASSLRRRTEELIAANIEDVKIAETAGRNAAFLDRLKLDAARIEGMASALESIASFPDPVGRDLGSWERPNGLKMERIAVPIGVIAMVYESRPNVGADAGALCLKSGNAVILRGGSESLNSSRVIVACLRDGLRDANLPEDAVQLVDTPERAVVGELLRCVEFIDLAIPRGGKGLVSLVQREARVATLLHLEGNCHTYIHAAADIEKAVKVVLNAKLRRTGICGATESLVIDRQIAGQVLPKLLDTLEGCEFRGEVEAIDIDKRVLAANDSDWGTEYLDSILSIKIVADLGEGLAFIAEHSSQHTDAIITEDSVAAERFFQVIDSAVLMHNASTQFSDGGEFGFGAEIGIATGKLHARGPVGLEQLTSYKYLVRGDGHIRPR